MSRLNFYEKAPSVKCKKIKCDIFPINLHLGIVDSIPDSPHALATTCITSQNNIFVILTHKMELEHIAHEAVHVSQYIESYIGDTFTSESEAYTVQWAFRHIHKYYEEKKNANTKSN